MAAARVQPGGIQSSGSVPSQLNTFVSATTPGSTIILGLAVYNTGTPTITITDNKGNGTFPQIGVTKTFGNVDVMIFACRNILGGASHQVTANSGGSSSYLSFGMVEVSGLDNAATILFSGAIGAGTAPNSGGVTAAAGDYLFGVVGQAGITTTITPGAGWSEVFEAEDNNTNLAVATEDRIASGAGTLSAVWTIGGSYDWMASVALFPASAGGAIVRQQSMMLLGCG